MNQSQRRQQIVIFEATQRCDLSCRFCYNVWHKHPETRHDDLEPRKTRELLDKLLSEAKPANFTISGGEPLLREDILDIVLQAALSGAQVTLITNGQTLDRKKTKRLVRAGVRTFEIQLLSDRASEHEYLQGVKESFERSIRGIEAVLSTKARMVAAFVATKLNLPRLHQTLRLAREMGVQGLMLNRFNPGGRGLDNLTELSPPPDDVLKMLEVAEHFAAQNKFPVSVSIPIPMCLVDIKRFPHLGYGFCSAGEEMSYPTLDSWGNLRPCNHSPLVLGNLFEKGFWELMDSPKRREFIETIPEICRGCEHLPECRASCRAAAIECGGMEPLLARIKALGK